jgi:hypothetical protein
MTGRQESTGRALTIGYASGRYETRMTRSEWREGCSFHLGEGIGIGPPLVPSPATVDQEVKSCVGIPML